jgi:urease accessory protein
MTRYIVLVSIALAGLTTAAEAHAGHVAGFLHPFTGLDHVAAMVAVGLLAARIGGRALWAVPLAFVGMMVAGAAVAMTGAGLPFVETGVLLSVVVLAGAVVLARRVSLAMAVSLAVVFAVFHGFAHGSEIPAGAAGLSFGLGFVAATAILHAIGLALGLAFLRQRRVVNTA